MTAVHVLKVQNLPDSGLAVSISCISFQQIKYLENSHKGQILPLKPILGRTESILLHHQGCLLPTKDTKIYTNVELKETITNSE